MESRFSFCSAACSVLGEGAKSAVECTADDALVDLACEVAGGGPEDPFADACAFAMGIAFETACVSAIEKGIDFDVDACKKSLC